MAINIAIDGPSAAGKSTIAEIISKKLNYVHLDTGAMYRCVALAVMRQGFSYDDEQAVISVLQKTDIQMKQDGSVFLNGEDVSDLIRTDAISMGASDVSKLPSVRTFLVELQQKMAESGGYIMDGRDIGTVVLKDAAVKIYLTATIEARAMRRYLENQKRGLNSDLKSLEKEIAQRDYQDTHRQYSPLTKADDAVEIDTSDMTIDEVVTAIMKIVEPCLKEQ